MGRDDRQPALRHPEEPPRGPSRMHRDDRDPIHSKRCRGAESTTSRRRTRHQKAPAGPPCPDRRRSDVLVSGIPGSSSDQRHTVDGAPAKPLIARFGAPDAHFRAFDPEGQLSSQRSRVLVSWLARSSAWAPLTGRLLCDAGRSSRSSRHWRFPGPRPRPLSYARTRPTSARKPVARSLDRGQLPAVSVEGSRYKALRCTRPSSPH